MNKEIKAFVVNSKAYDDGERDLGEWVSFPVTKEEMKSVYDRIGIDETYFKEIFFDDFKTDVAGLINVLNVYTDIDELNYLAPLSIRTSLIRACQVRCYCRNFSFKRCQVIYQFCFQRGLLCAD